MKKNIYSLRFVPFLMVFEIIEIQSKTFVKDNFAFICFERILNAPQITFSIVIDMLLKIYFNIVGLICN